MNKNNIVNTKIMLSGATIVAAAALIIGATYAFFSDTETSTDNVFAAGEIDLKIGNTSYALDYNVVPAVDDPIGALVENTGTSWEISDLDDQVFFNFRDLKPGDYGEDTISLQAGSNDAWICAAAQITADEDNTLTEPEGDLDDTLETGELDEELNFAFWADDGDNVFETGESTFLTGPLSGLDTAGKIALADSSGSVWGTGPVAGSSTVHIGKIWCYGTLTPDPEATGDGTPITRGTGWACNGTTATDIGQTDSVMGDLQFYAVQARNNGDFTCAEDYTPDWSDGGTGGQVVEVDEVSDLATDLADAQTNPKWFFYNDENDQIDNSLGSFVAGPGTPPNPNGSAQMSVSGTQRRNIATYQFKDVKLADIDAMSFATYSQSAGDGSPGTGRAPYLHFNVDFNNTDTWQSRLVYVPDNNGTVTADTWQTWDAIDGGSANWVYSGAVWPGTGDPGTTSKTWSQILALYPNAETRSTDSWLGVRVGEPYANGFTGNVDNFLITINGVTKEFNFDN